MTDIPASAPLGTVYLPASPATPVGRFDFVVDLTVGREVEIGTLVAADTAEGVIVGSVVDMRTIGHHASPVEIEFTRRAEGPGPLAPMGEAMLATVQVFASPRMRPTLAGTVRAATEEEVLTATGQDRISWPLPAGVVPLATGAGHYARVSLDGEMVLGPESAHLTIGGLSGAAKTSYAGVLLRSMLHASEPGHTVAAILFNVKGEDLIYLDREPEPGYEITDEDRAMYAAMDVPASPFENVRVYAPALPGGVGTHSSRSDASPIAWGLEEVWNDLPTLLRFNRHEDEKLDSFFSEFRDSLVTTGPAENRVNTINRMLAWLDARITDYEAREADKETTGGMAWRSHHVMTLRRIRRMFSGLPHRAGGLIAADRVEGQDIPDRDWVDGQVVVVDVAGLDSQIQGMAIGRIVKKLLSSAEEGMLGVDHLVVMADELNSFAPAQGGNDMAEIKRILARVASQGRYAGVALVGLAQRLSRVDAAVIENAATRALGVSTELELSQPLYGHLATGLTERLATLPKGQMALWHQAYRSAMVVRFPRPAWRTGKSRTTAGTRPTPLSVLRLSAESKERLLEGQNEADVAAALARHGNHEDALAELTRRRVPDMRRTALHEPSRFDPDNPFALGDEE